MDFEGGRLQAVDLAKTKAFARIVISEVIDRDGGY
jgi:hypothetical protein